MFLRLNFRPKHCHKQRRDRQQQRKLSREQDMELVCDFLCVYAWCRYQNSKIWCRDCHRPLKRGASCVPQFSLMCLSSNHNDACVHTNIFHTHLVSPDVHSSTTSCPEYWAVNKPTKRQKGEKNNHTKTERHSISQAIAIKYNANKYHTCKPRDMQITNWKMNFYFLIQRRKICVASMETWVKSPSLSHSIPELSSVISCQGTETPACFKSFEAFKMKLWSISRY